MPGISDVKKICLEIFSNDIAKCLVGCEVSNLVVLFTKFPRRYHQNRYTIDKWPFYEYFWPFLANSMIICHKTEVQTVILRCLTNLTWFKSNDTKCKYFHFWTRLTCEKIATDKWPFYDQFWPYF